MKKLLKYFAMCLLLMIIGIVNVTAAEISITAKKSGNNISVIVSNAKDYVLGYDKESVQCYSGSCTNENSSKPYGKMISSDSNEFIFTIISKEYKLLSFNVIKNDGSDSAVKSTSYEINVDKKPAPSTTSSSSTTTTTTTTSSKSTNANLKSIEIKDAEDTIISYTPVFKPEIYEYTMDVEATVDKVDISALPEDTKSNVLISTNATKQLTPGENNKITITVTAESGLQKIYTLNIKRAALSTDATLKDLKIKEIDDFKFSSSKFEYDVNVDKEIEKLTLDYILNDESSTVEVIGNENLKDNSKVKLLVTSTDGTKKEYILNIIKETKSTTKVKKVSKASNEKNPIIILLLSIGAFSLIGSIVYVIKNK